MVMEPLDGRPMTAMASNAMARPPASEMRAVMVPGGTLFGNEPGGQVGDPADVHADSGEPARVGPSPGTRTVEPNPPAFS